MGRNSASVKVGDGLRAISIKELVDSLQKQSYASTNSLIDLRKKKFKLYKKFEEFKERSQEAGAAGLG
jgi:hypothetical protein